MTGRYMRSRNSHRGILETSYRRWKDLQVQQSKRGRGDVLGKHMDPHILLRETRMFTAPATEKPRTDIGKTNGNLYLCHIKIPLLVGFVRSRSMRFPMPVKITPALEGRAALVAGVHERRKEGEEVWGGGEGYGGGEGWQEWSCRGKEKPPVTLYITCHP